MDTNNNLRFQVREQPQIETSIHEVPKSEIEVDIIEELPNTDEANTMMCLENALLEKFGYDAEKLSKKEFEVERNQAMEAIRPHIGKVRGHLPKAEENKAESPVQFETYVAVPERNEKGEVIKDKEGNPKPFLYGLQAKVKWEIEVEFQGKKEKIQFFQNVRAPSPLPREPKDFAGIEHAKHKSLLYLKMFTTLHKKGVMGHRYNLERDVEKSVVVSKLVTNLRATNHLKMTHYPNPLVYNSFYRAGTGLSERDGTAYSSDVQFEGYKISLGYSEEMDLKGRRLKEYKVGDDLPNNAGKAQVAMTKYLKVNVANPKLSYGRFYDPNKQIDPFGVPYGTHLYQMAQKATIKGAPITNYDNMVKSDTKDLKGDIEKDPSINTKFFRDYEIRLLQKNLEDFEKGENQLRMNVLDKATDGNPSVLQTLFLNDSKVGNLAEKLAKDFEDKTKDNTLEHLKVLYKNNEVLKKGIQGLKGQKEKIEKAQNHIKQLGYQKEGPSKEVKKNKLLHNVLLSKIEMDLDNVNKKLQLYANLEQKMNDAEDLLKQKNML